MNKPTRPLAMALLAAAATTLTLLNSGCQPSAFSVTPYLQSPTPTGITVQWLSPRPADAIIEYGQGNRLDRKLGPIAGRELVHYPQATNTDPTAGEPAVEYLYQARLDGLTPDTAYRYRVTIGQDRREAAFRTAPDKPKRFSFVAYGDTRTDWLTHRRIARRIRDSGPDLLIHTGDLTGGGELHTYMPEFFDPLHDVIDHAPIVTVTGNHDKHWDIYHALLPMAGNGKWYSFDYGNVHFIAVDSAAEFEERDEELAWLEKDLAASKAEWKIAFYHYPTYDVSRRHTAEGREDFAPLFRKYGVDIVLTGHCHGYQRIRPLFTRGQNEAHPITYMIVAGGGAPLHAMETSDFAAHAARVYCFTKFIVDGSRLTAETIGLDAKPFDPFVIEKIDGQFSKEYLAQALPEEDFDKLRDFVRGQLDTVLPAVPQPGKPVKFSFPFTAPPDADISVKLYVDNSSVARAVLSAGKTGQLAGQIRVDEPVSVKDSVLSPKIQFECHFTSGRNKDVVYSKPFSVATGDRGAK